MTEQQTPVLERPVTPPPAPSGPKRKKRKGKVKLIIGLVIAAAVLAGLIWLVWYVVFRDDTSLGEPITASVYRGSIQSVVEGSGLTRAKDSAAVTPSSGTILELMVHEGDQVTQGQQLYRMDDTAAREAVAAAQESVDNCQKELQAVYDKIAELSITAPHAGNLRDVADLKVGDTVSEGDTIATLVNDTRLKLSLYYSYAYEDAIQVGQTAQISVPAVMGSWTGTVETINKVRFVSSEGAVHFEVVFVLDNPGTLTEGMDASASLTADDGSAIYPYENGKLEYYETTAIRAKATGPVEAVNLLNYADVSAGQQLVRLGAENTDEEIASRQEALKAAQEKLEEANSELAKYNAVAPISGTVLSCNLVEGEEVQSGQGITIADTSVMTIEIQVDERNVQYVTPGMSVDIDYQGTPFFGTLESIALTGTAENGMSTFPAVVKVENPDGLIRSNSYASYSFVASQSSDCLLVPTNAVKYVSFSGIAGLDPSLTADVDGMEPEADGADMDMDGMEAVADVGASNVSDVSAVGADGTGYVVFVRADQAPENAILEPDPTWGCPEGFWAVPVVVGLSDTTQVEIISGLNEGDEVFIGYENSTQMYY